MASRAINESPLPLSLYASPRRSNPPSSNGTLLPLSSSDELPARFGRYDVIAKVASGGMADVYAGRISGESGFAKLVAIKAMRSELVEEEKYVAMFLDEARVAANISSPYVVSTLDLGRTDAGLPYLVMELVIGASVAQLARASRPPWPIGLVVEFICQAAAGLHDAHEAKDSAGTPLEIVHRDVSPQNILVGTDGRVRITDFGVARAIMRITKTRTGEIKGKIRYFSPEQAVAEATDRRSDIFALGIIMWELLTGEQLFRGKNLLEVHQSVLSQVIVGPETVRADVPSEISAVLMRALSRRPEDRFPTADAFARDLRKAAARADVDLATTSDIVAFVRAHATTTVDRLSRSIRESATPSIPSLPDLLGQTPSLPRPPAAPVAEQEEPTTLDSQVIPPRSPSLAPLAEGGEGFVRRWWRAFLRWLGLA